MEESQPDFITVEEVATILGVTPRQAARYQSKVRTQKAGSRVLYHKGDIEEQAARKGRAKDATRHFMKPSKPELVPISEMLEYLRERDADNKQLQQQLLQAAHRIGELEERLAHQQKLLTDERKPWWKRLFRRD